MAKKSDIILLLEKDIDISNRRIYFGSMADSEGGSFSWATVERAIRSMHHLQNISSAPIELHMNSNGGDCLAMLRLLDCIQASPCQIKFYGSGEISSSATWIMAVCDERYLTQYTRVCIHDSPAAGIEEMSIKLTDRNIQIEEDIKLQIMLNQIYADNSKMPIEFWNTVVKRDLWLTAEETLELGLIDKIIMPIKRGNLRRKRIASLSKVKDSAKLNKIVKNILKDVQSDVKTLKLNINPAMQEIDEDETRLCHSPCEEKEL